MRRAPLTVCCVALLLLSLRSVTGPAGAEPAVPKVDGAGKDDCDAPANGTEKKRPKVLLDWKLGREPEEEEDEGGEEPLVGDRPDFVESSSNVGAGRIQLEMGYTFTQDRDGGARTRSHSFPEALLRIGVYADWLELRIGQNFGSETTLLGLEGADGQGAEDLYLGIGLGLTEQKGFLPETRILLQMTVPSGSDDFSQGDVLPGFNYLYGWEVIKDRLSFAGSTGVNRARDASDHTYTEISQGLTTGITLAPKLGMYLETFALFPSGAVAPDTSPEYYLDGGFMLRVTNNLQFDVRAGVGLNRHADDFFTGAGVVVRY